MMRRLRSPRDTAAASERTQRCTGASACAGRPHRLRRQHHGPEKPTLRCRDQSSSQLAWPSPPNQVTHGDHGTYVPVEEPSTASKPDLPDPQRWAECESEGASIGLASRPPCCCSV